MKLLKPILPVALILPVLFFSWEIVTLEFSKSSGKEVVLPITGYDPRDLLAGHYLRYDILYQSDSICQNPNTNSHNKTDLNQRHCVCYPHSGKIKEGEGAFISDCNPDILKDQRICRLYLRGTCRYGRFKIGNERFYVNETKALDYEKRLREEKVHIRLKVDSEGKAITDSLIWEDGSSL
ncbi:MULTISPECIES: GDYXXLXY domain-containing protein [Leptospira]|uniref:GDYXXLXY protein n=1 Tax=Leptospira borgpetersenii serovar Ballum TaxID=280505 RepID=A0A0E3B1U7_LEPBO|nr:MULTISPECIES: GDYXXLXY domain-containing protein [Leptospira]ALO25425.1 GDYXXLXY protein [Leptospira borgpetersenii serovar Ballum]ANH00342.1 GDYXXLXY protein [Leptospira borgpetersenii str. 4E]AXX15768.1 GDYXXLXY protein [Leptospira borgpetersenii serovar Ceylonica]KGE23776.1 GDYXXLXY protein [Leptospira borgpetersenii serovar Ballum]MBE8159505.1 GDYXXLXY domain-containing protein [Leptospira borgpetersenii serovar Ballum]